MRPNLMRRDPYAQLTFPNRRTVSLQRVRTIRLDWKSDTVRQNRLHLLLPTLLTVPDPRNQLSSGTDLGQCTLFRGAYP